MKIYIDADACPVKDEVYRVAGRYNVAVVLVANSWMRIPQESFIRLEVVDDNVDAADDWIVSEINPGDLLVTADIPLIDRCIKKGAHVIGHKGNRFTESSISEAVATRNLLAGLRDIGEVTGGPAPFTKRDRSKFLQELNNLIHRLV